MLLTRLWCLVFWPRIIALKPKVIEQSHRKGFEYESTSILIRPFYKARAPVRLTQERPKCALHHGKMSTNKCRARYEITHEHVSNDLKMWIKRLHTEIHNIITIYIHYKSIYFKIITCIILGLVNSNVFACKTNSAFNDFVDSCITGKRNRTGARAL